MAVDQEPGYALIESLRYTEQGGYFLLQRHLDRLRRSAEQLGFDCDVHAVGAALQQCASELRGLAKVRLELARDGTVTMDAQAMTEQPAAQLAVAKQPVLSVDGMLGHKTTRRAIYADALASVGGGVDDAILWNERGELTETCVGNLVLRLGEQWLTPALSSGLLPGTFREQLLSEGRLQEATLELSALDSAAELYRINSVRLWTKVQLRPSSADTAEDCRS